MRIEKLNNDKIKVTLTTADLITLDIDVNQLAPNSKELHSFLFHIMETIREKTGFNPYSGQVVVEATPSNEGIIIIVSKLNTSQGRISREQFDKATAVKARIKKNLKTEIFYFDNFDDLCMALMEIPSTSLVDGSLYKLSEMFCFVIQNEEQNAKCLHIMTEFSSQNSRYPLQLTYIKEHGKLIAKGNELITMTENMRNLI